MKKNLDSKNSEPDNCYDEAYINSTKSNLSWPLWWGAQSNFGWSGKLVDHKCTIPRCRAVVAA